MVKKYYIARNYRSKFDAAGKAKMDCETILDECGWENIGFKQTWISNPIIGTCISAIGISWALLRLKRNSIVCLQYPLNKFYRFVLWGAGKKKSSIITIVHDVYTLKGKAKKSPHEVELLNKSKSLIIHNQSMSNWFKSQNINSKLIPLEIFDYLHTPVHTIIKKPIDTKMIRVVFAGNMGEFVYMLDNLEKGNYKFDLYGVKFKQHYIKDQNKTILNYKGAFKSNEIIDYIEGDFGLVWYGDSLDSCTGASGQYLKYNNPHKLSLYIQCEMPVIIWKKAGMAPFVEKNKIGITVDSLFDLKTILNSLSTDQYKEMKNNVAIIKEKISQGYYLKTSIDKAL